MNDVHGYDLVIEVDEETINSLASAAFHSSFFTSFKGNAVIRGVDFPYTVLISEPPYVELYDREITVRLAMHITSGSIRIDVVAYADIAIGPGISIKSIQTESIKFWGHSPGIIGKKVINTILNSLPLHKLLRLEDLETDIPLDSVIPSSMIYGSPTFNISAASLASFKGSIVIALCLNGCSLEKKTPLASFADGRNVAIAVSELALKDILEDIWPNLSGPIVEKGTIDSVSGEYLSWLKEVSRIKRPFWGGSKAEINYTAEIVSEIPKIRIADELEMYDTDMSMNIQATALIPKPFTSKKIPIYSLETDAKASVDRALVDVYPENGRLLAKITDMEFNINAPKSIPNLILKVARNRLESKILTLPPIDLTEIMENKIDHNIPFTPKLYVHSTSVLDSSFAVYADIDFDNVTATSFPYVADISNNVVHTASCANVNCIKGINRRCYASLSDAFKDGFKGASDCLRRYCSNDTE